MPRIPSYSDEPSLPDLYDADLEAENKPDPVEGDEPISKGAAIVAIGKTIVHS